MFGRVRYVGPMHPFKTILGGALVAGSLTGCVINTGGTDTNLTLNTLSDPSTSTDGTTTEGTGTDGTSTDGTGTESGTDTAAPTTGVPTTGTGTTDGTTTGGAACGWDPAESYYACGFEGEDPNGTYPIACPAGLVEGELCSVSMLTGEGCCDADGNSWYCGNNGTDEVLVFESCDG